MKLTKKHFESTAEIIRSLPLPAETKEIVMNTFSMAYMETNSKFNVLKFKNACKGKSWEQEIHAAKVASFERIKKMKDDAEVIDKIAD